MPERPLWNEIEVRISESLMIFPKSQELRVLTVAIMPGRSGKLGWKKENDPRYRVRARLGELRYKISRGPYVIGGSVSPVVR